MCVCVDHLNRCKTSFVLMMVVFRDFSLCHSSTLNYTCRGMERTYEAPSNEAPHMILGYHQGRLVTYLQHHFISRQWQPAKPRTGMSFFSCIRTFLRTSVPTGFHSLYGFRNLIYCRFRQMEQLPFARTKKEFIYIGFPAMSSNFRLSDFRGLFVHDRCTPQQ